MTTRNRLHYAAATALVATLALAGCKKEEPATTATPPASEPAAPAPAEPAPVAEGVTVTTVTLGNAANPDKQIAAPMTSFSPQDKIIVSVATDGTDDSVEVGSRLVFQDGQTASEQKQALSTDGAEITNIEFVNANPWPAGKYKAEVLLDGNVVETREFEVK